MATIQERKDKEGKVRYRAIVRMKGHPPQSATFKRKTDAKKWIQDIESAIREGRHFKTVEAKRHTLGELIDRYKEEVIPYKTKITGDRQRPQLDWWKKQIGYVLLSDLSPSLITQQRTKLLNMSVGEDKKRSPASANRYMSVLSHALNTAMREWEWVEDNPMRKIKKLPENNAIIRFLSEEERSGLLEACKESDLPVLYTIVVLALSTGARKMEIMGLKWRDIDLKKGVIRLTKTKNKEARVLPLKGHAHDQVEELSKIRRIDSDLLFPGGNPQSPIEINKHWYAAMKKAGIENFRFHDLRHTAASYLAMNGATLAEIADILGHKTLQMVKRYAHLSEPHTASVVEKMNEKIFGQ